MSASESGSHIPLSSESSRPAESLLGHVKSTQRSLALLASLVFLILHQSLFPTFVLGFADSPCD